MKSDGLTVPENRCWRWSRLGKDIADRKCADRLERACSALARLEPFLMLVDHEYPPLAANHLALPVTRFQRAQRILDLHFSSPLSRRLSRQLFRMPVFAHGGRDWDRTSDPYDVNVVLYR